MARVRGALLLTLLVKAAVALPSLAAAQEPPSAGVTPAVLASPESAGDWRSKDEAYWRSKLTPEQFKICRQSGTERAFTGKYYDHHGKGAYLCSSCGNVLFSSQDKFESGTGWPSFVQGVKPETLELLPDSSHGLQRIEVRCARCGAHLGHVFDDGPKPTGKRYCINSACLVYQAEP